MLQLIREDSRGREMAGAEVQAELEAVGREGIQEVAQEAVRVVDEAEAVVVVAVGENNVLCNQIN